MKDAPAHLPSRSTPGRVLLSPSSPGAEEGAGSRSEEGALSLQNAPAPGAAPPLLPATWLAARAGLLGGRRACPLLSHRGARSAALGPAASPSQVPAGVAAAPSPEQPSEKLHVARGGEGLPCGASTPGQSGHSPTKDQTWLRLHRSPTATLATTRRGWEVGPRSPSLGWLQ